MILGLISSPGSDKVIKRVEACVGIHVGTEIGQKVPDNFQIKKKTEYVFRQQSELFKW